MNTHLNRMTGFMSAGEDYNEAQAVIIGVPMDFTISLRPGSRTGPQYIRTLSYGLEEYSLYQDRSLEEIKFYDAGDINLPLGNVSGSLARIEEVAEEVFTEGKIPFFLGGEHLVTYPLVKACHRHYPELVVLHFDAHADLRCEYEGEENSHATVMHKVARELGPKRVYQFGIRSAIKEEMEFAKGFTTLYLDEIFPALVEVILELQGKPIYISLDIDVVDPAFAPGTGTPEPGGCTAREILQAIRAMKDLQVVGMDLVEVSPVNDHSDRTAILGAKVLREAMLAFVK